MPEDQAPPQATRQLLEQLQWRYAVKRFDPSRRVPDQTWQTLEQSLILTPSSYGLQPWKFVVITDPAIKAQLPALSWNQKQPLDCSHMVVLAARRTMDANYIDSFIEHLCRTRKLESQAMAGYRNVLVNTIKNIRSHLDWNTHQVYIALGQLMVSAAMLGIDTCPMEGIDHDQYDRLLGLDATEYTSAVACAVGYRHPDDTQAHAVKVRFGADDMIVRM
jgi:nitroreductase